MKVLPKFPPSLLHEPMPVRVTYFKKVRVKHSILTSTVSLLDQKANESLDRRLILLVGGTGVGKSAALEQLVAMRNSRRAEELKSRPELVPAIFMEAESPDKGSFDMGTLYRDGLVQMKAALIDRTFPMVDRKTREGTLLTLGLEGSRRNMNAFALKLRFRSELNARECELVGVDEAINVFKTGRAKSEPDRLDMLKSQADKLKTLTNKTPAALVLAGAYDFFELTLCSGQIARRSTIVHMQPYEQTTEGTKDFLTATIELIAHLPICHSIDLNEVSTEIFLQSLGCIGIAKEILTQALTMALREGDTMTMTHIRKSFYAAAQLEVFKAEMKEGSQEIARITSLSELAEDAAQVTGTALAVVGETPKLKPGETRPSHRSGITDSW